MTERFEIRRLISDAEIAGAYGLMRELRPHLVLGEFVGAVRAQQAETYELIGLFDEGHLVCLAGIRNGLTLSRGPHLFVDDLVTAAAVRGQGYGKAMLRWIGRLARERGFPIVCLDSRDTAVSFYERVGFVMSTGVPCKIETAELLKESGAASS